MRKVVLIGDSIRMAYEPVVRELLDGRAEVWGPEENGGDSRNVLANLRAWGGERPANVIHLNCGLHDLKLRKDGTHQVPVDEFAENVQKIIAHLADRTRAKLVWATITPVHEERHQAREGCDFKRLLADVEDYNRAALEAVNSAGVAVNDLNGVIEKHGIVACLSTDGVHMNSTGNRLLAEAVAKAVMA